MLVAAFRLPLIIYFFFIKTIISRRWLRQPPGAAPLIIRWHKQPRQPETSNLRKQLGMFKLTPLTSCAAILFIYLFIYYPARQYKIAWNQWTWIIFKSFHFSDDCIINLSFLPSFTELGGSIGAPCCINVYNVDIKWGVTIKWRMKRERNIRNTNIAMGTFLTSPSSYTFSKKSFNERSTNSRM